MIEDNRITLAVLDMAGTTVMDDGIVLRAFADASAAAGLVDGSEEANKAREYVIDTMGQSKITVFRALFTDEQRAQTANRAFEASYNRIVSSEGATPIDGAVDSIMALRDAGIKVALSTGFSQETQEALLTALEWHSLVDLMVCPSNALRGRPYPDMVLYSLMRLGIDGVGNVAVLGDTTSDIVTGLRAGARTVAGTLTGAHDSAALTAAGATHVFPSIIGFTEHLLHP